ncbi:hypothetical protein NWP17_00245 [Chrysosporum bergii ANA360D]|jgi:hypothetical protein|uniref:Uncharacterized protein n=1 Tax=Chrysosporum bergii ANA360D TaxID=617107 RepID=A0AA43GNR6_9CYAN|nr:hypothetical protein [Chrysosporum bergii]MDH6058894.1 hypothetical protein [Chrysosporum bergii ANA360D]
MNRSSSGLFVGLQTAITSVAISQRTDSVNNLPVCDSINDSGLNFDRGSGRIGAGC